MMTIYCLGPRLAEPVRFGLQVLEKAFREKGIPLMKENVSMYSPNAGGKERSILVSVKPERDRSPEGFSIEKEGKAVRVTGFGAVGAMYALFDLAEAIRYRDWDGVASCTHEPFLKKRGVKFNLPFQPYAEGELFEKNKDTVRDIAFWRRYIDFLAMNKYNCLSLWSENPFEYMIDIEKYPDASDLNAREREDFRRLFTDVFAHAKNRGMEVYIITWNLRISPGIARGLGLPAELGMRGHDRRSIGLRQHSGIIKDYFREAIKTLMYTYPDLTGIGTSNSEELTGTAEEREGWVAETYLEGLKELGWPVPFIHRTNMSNGVIAQKMFLSQYDGAEKYVSWKYSNAHMYSHPEPQFESLLDAWGEMDMSGFRVLYTVRNDDFHNLRGCDPQFISDYVKGMKKPYVDGFYWGADGYLWAGEFQHSPNCHVQWDYSFEKHWMQFEMIGRLSYDPELEPAIWTDKFKRMYGDEAGPALYGGLRAGVRMLCAVNRLYWINYDYQWHPETLLCVTGFKTILDFIAGLPMPGVGVMGIIEYVEAGPENAGGRETPPRIFELIRNELEVMEKSIASIENGPAPTGELECVYYDVKAWHALGSYYLRKLAAAMELLYFAHSKDSAHKKKAVALLREALSFWKELSYIGSLHYLPYRMARVGQIFGWSYYIKEVEQDIARAEAFMPDTV